MAVARTQGGLEELDDEIKKDGGSATLVPLNLTDFEGIARLGAALHERHGKIDILIGNAGVAGPSSPLGHIELKPWNDVMAVNATANFQLIRCMELCSGNPIPAARYLSPRRATGRSPISVPTRLPRLHLKRWWRVWANETASTPVRINLFDPGPIRTRMRAAVFPGRGPR